MEASSQIDRQGLDNAIRNGEMAVHFQPRVLLAGDAGGNVCGFEALVRWMHPRLGMLPPRDFIQKAVDFGLINDLTEYVFEQALDCIAAWRSDGDDYRVSVNLFPSILDDDSLVDFLSRTLSRHELPASALTIEITESCFTEDVPSNIANMVRMRTRGLVLAMDDFGTGSRSLVPIHLRPFTELKIDHRLVTRLDESREVRQSVEKIIVMAHRVDLLACAVGIESRASYDLLRKLGCDQGQGYFIARPMPAEQVPGWLASWAADLEDNPPGG